MVWAGARASRSDGGGSGAAAAATVAVTVTVTVTVTGAVVTQARAARQSGLLGVTFAVVRLPRRHALAGR